MAAVCVKAINPHKILKMHYLTQGGIFSNTLILMKKTCFVLFLGVILGISTLSPAADAKEQLWVYTSVYKEYISLVKKAFEEKNPNIEVMVFQGGSEKLQAKVEAELTANSPQVDVVMTADPFWAHEIEKRGLALPGSPTIETTYYSIMVMVAHKDYPADKRPKSFQDLTKSEFKGLVQMGSPLDSGTMFSTVAVLSRKYGWDYFKKLRDNQVAANGGSSAVLQKIESGEKKVGIALLENILSNLKRQSPIVMLYPEDGAIAIPNMHFTMKTSKHAVAAELFRKYLVSKDGQNLLRTGNMYTVRKDVLPPEGSKTLAEITKNALPWTPELVDAIATDAKKIKKKFSELVLE